MCNVQKGCRDYEQLSQNLLREVRVMSGDRGEQFATKGNCFNCSYDLVMSEPTRYELCIGVADFMGFPLEHGWVFDKVENAYIDTTIQFKSERTYFVLKQFSFEELSNKVVSLGKVPDFHDVNMEQVRIRRSASMKRDVNPAIPNL